MLGETAFQAECRYFSSFSRSPSVLGQIVTDVFHWVSPFLSNSRSARFCTFFTSTWCRATISGCSVKGSTFTHSSWCLCSLRDNACGGIMSWAGVCIFCSWVLSHLYLCLYIHSLLLVWGQRTGRGWGPLRRDGTQVLAGVQSPENLVEAF